MTDTEPLGQLLDRTKAELLKIAVSLRETRPVGNAVLKAQWEGVACQLDDRATACGIWLIAVNLGIFAPDREEYVRECCAEWLRMIGAA